MIRVLFVDDSPEVLDGLQNRLRRLRRQWEMTFVASAEQALQRLRESPYDALVSDVRMPGMDGAALLKEAQVLRPGMLRVVLTGETDKRDLLRVLPLAHRVLSKPCEVEVMRATIDGSRALEGRIHSPAVLRAVGSVEALPSAPSCYLELTAVLERDASSAADVAAVVERDPALAGRVLQLANSGLLSVRREIPDLRTAVTYLGVNTLRSLLLTTSLVSTVAERRCAPDFCIENSQRHALRAASFASRLVDDPTERQVAVSAALLHDVGELLLATLDGRFYGVDEPILFDPARPRHECERDAIGCTHAEIGAYLLSLWGLPFSIVAAVADHHEPAQAAGPWAQVAAAVYTADRLADAVDADDGDVDPAAATATLETLEQLGTRDAYERLLREWQKQTC